MDALVGAISPVQLFLTEAWPAPLGSVTSFFSSRRRHTRYWRDWSPDVCSSDLQWVAPCLPPVQMKSSIGRDANPFESAPPTVDLAPMFRSRPSQCDADADSGGCHDWYNSAESRVPAVAAPPAIKTRPSTSSVAVWPRRSDSIEPVVAQVPVLGSHSSADSEGVHPPPPATSTWPSESNVAVWSWRKAVVEPAGEKTPLCGSYSSFEVR